MYIIDPLYTLPLLIALLVALWRRDGVGLRWNQAGLLISTLYLGWSMVVQGIATQHIDRDLTQKSIQLQQVLVTPTAFNTLVWRTVIMTPDRYGEAYWSMLSPDRALEIHWHPRNPQLFDAFKGDWYAERVAWFSHGFYAMRQQGNDTLISDLRMGKRQITPSPSIWDRLMHPNRRRKESLQCGHHWRRHGINYAKDYKKSPESWTAPQSWTSN